MGQEPCAIHPNVGDDGVGLLCTSFCFLGVDEGEGVCSAQHQGVGFLVQAG